MSKDVNVNTGGVGLGGLLGLLFVGLKLGGVIDWSWLWVTAPFWVPLALALLVLGAMGAVLLGAFIVATWADFRTERRVARQRRERLSNIHTRGKR